MSVRELRVTTSPSPSPYLRRGLKNRHLQLIAIGGAIGTGLFMGSGKMISLTGPAVIFVYMIIGLMVFLIMRALGELLLSNLHYRTFGDIAKDLIGPWAGFFVSWSYWLGWVVACVADIIAITSYVSFFDATIPPWVPALVAAVALTLLNLQPVKFYGETEFWFALIKVVAVLALIGAGLVLIVTGFTNPDTGTRATLTNLWEHGGMFPFGVSGFILGFQLGIFAFIGVELVGTVAAETENPRKTFPKAINSIVARILVFYIGSLVIIMSITPWDDLAPDRSPFVTTLVYAGFGIAAAVINLVVLTSAASSANSGVYSASRMLYNLAHDGHAPKKLSLVTRDGVPTKAVFLTCVFLFTAIPLLYAGDGIVTAFTFVSTICATLILFTWGTIVVSYIRYRHLHPDRHAQSGFKMPLGRIAPWIVLAFFAFIVGALLYGNDTRLAVAAAPVWFGILTVLWTLRKRRLLKEGRPITRAIPVTPHPLDDE